MNDRLFQLIFRFKKAEYIVQNITVGTIFKG